MSSHRSNERFVGEEGNASVRSVKKKWRAGVLGALVLAEEAAKLND